MKTHPFRARQARDEYPLSESGTWKHIGLNWTSVIVEKGLAHGTETGPRPGDSAYDDSYAYLSGFSPNQSAEATLYIDPSLSGGGNREVELLLRWSDSANNAAGYEINLHYLGGYTQIVRWDGPLGKYTYLAWGSTPRPRTGDKFKATMIGSEIAVYLNGVEINRATDTTYATGNPGMAFYVDPGTANGGYGFTSYTAHALP